LSDFSVDTGGVGIDDGAGDIRIDDVEHDLIIEEECVWRAAVCKCPRHYPAGRLTSA
jgi:hypothetical protein